jgi:hypothetical protein
VDVIDDAPFMKLQGLPTDLRPVTSWPNRDEAWTNVAKPRHGQGYSGESQGDGFGITAYALATNASG